MSGPNEAPRFAPRVAGDEKWIDGFSPNGVNGGFGYVYTLAVDESNNVYLGGDFYSAGGTLAANIAKRDGSTWSALGGGLDNAVIALAYDPVNHRLYAGGAFHQICDTPDCAVKSTMVRGVALCSGGTWSPLGDTLNGVNDYVFALALDDYHDLYVGGHFTGYCTTADCIGFVPSHGIAKWRWALGGFWTTLGSGGVDQVSYSGDVLALAWSGTASEGTLYVGGAFATAAGGTLPANSLARYTRSSNTLTALTRNGMNGVQRSVFALALDTVDAWLYIGGDFDYLCGMQTAPHRDLK